MAKTDTTAALRPAPAGSPDGRLSEADILHRDLSTAIILFHEAVSRRLGMTAADRKCLAVLGELGEVTPGRLAQATGLSTGAITGVVDRLEKAGCAARRPNPEDRRSILVRPVRQPGMMEMLIPVFGSLSASMAGLAARYTPDELALIQGYLAETTAVLKRETEKVEQETDAAARQ